MGRIHVLEDLVANQIAAGEVVERPAAAVKELIENAIDAGAKKIQVIAKDGGLTLLEVQDDGSGIAPEDVKLAFLRHATSKLRNLGDLSKLRSLGFRGEALPSIAAISKVTLRTRIADAEEGVQVRFEAGQLVEQTPVGCPKGTRVTVQDLFYNTPARLKFVRSLQTENAHIVDVVARAAMARPDLSFRVQIDEREALHTLGDGSAFSAFTAIQGRNLAKAALWLSLTSPDYALAGLIVAPEFARKSRSDMWFAVNGRPIRSVALGNAVLAGYSTLVPKGRFPVVAISLSMNPTLIDVNVHPSKTEVRFSEERDVCALLTEAVKQTLEKGVASPIVQSLQQDTASVMTHTKEGSIVAETSSASTGRSLLAAKPATSWSQQVVHEQVSDKKAMQVALDLFGVHSAKPKIIPHVDRQVADSVKEEEKFPLHRQLRAVAQVLKLVIVAEDGEDIYLIDQHAAHERVLYEAFLGKIRRRENYPLPLLVPLTIELHAAKIELLMQYEVQAADFGLRFEPFGEGVIRVTHVPSIWEGLDIAKLAHDAIYDLLEERKVTAFQNEIEDKVIMRACKAAIKANSTMSQMEMDALLEAMQKLDNPFTCPHGRPTAIRITRSQLEREFRRTL
ncbi:DNA mismatch repair endonuclease MutL [Sulfoacidibacillus thermotolerans]|uniref:DNA mismatch repair protein MutL n=1 Tax=Sulfoacidibacillus thermotolerans TaxID=1765684 RepID=A0A2U3DAG8_SULT2|nr:DNA mismatch repair endonuclease MutL [Sulfoacidibacillus thermotolerans]PWI58255.1 hypothetical protein BM613_04850 [Sulfoacidibacillus thermotolerans]